ncbi:MAG: hypothetical protein QOE08_2436 [Thermoleophilaceae bacterium]|jgi:hypothetical protein|nr:hypothetical protein [Thermoleophilaceae bacterium]
MAEKTEKKVWVLDTETKGTGAQMVPLDTTVKPGARPSVVRERPVREREAAPREPRRFKVVDVMTRQVLSGDAGTRETVELLKGIRSSVDVSVHVWEPGAGKWQPLTQREQKMLWDLAARAG